MSVKDSPHRPRVDGPGERTFVLVPQAVLLVGASALALGYAVTTLIRASLSLEFAEIILLQCPSVSARRFP